MNSLIGDRIKILRLKDDLTQEELAKIMPWVRLFEYIKYAKVNEDTRHLFEEWLTDVIKDYSKLL